MAGAFIRTAAGLSAFLSPGSGWFPKNHSPPGTDGAAGVQAVPDTGDEREDLPDPIPEDSVCGEQGASAQRKDMGRRDTGLWEAGWPAEAAAAVFSSLS